MGSDKLRLPLVLRWELWMKRKQMNEERRGEKTLNFRGTSFVYVCSSVVTECEELGSVLNWV